MSDQNAVKTARELTDGMDRLTKGLAAAVLYSRRSRVIIWFSVAGWVLDVALTVVLAIVAVQADHASHSAANASASSMALCQAGNVSRHQQSDIWTYFLRLVGPAKTPAGARAETLLRARIRSDFAPRNCSSLGRPRP